MKKQKKETNMERWIGLNNFNLRYTALSENRNTNIQIVDAICGKGKTQWAIQNLIDNYKHHKDKFIYVTPFLEELDRVYERCKQENIYVYIPMVRKDENTKELLSKGKEVFKAMQEGKNIIMTHKLFEYITIDWCEEIERQDYDLYLDEVPNVFSYDILSSKDWNLLISTKMIELGTYLDNCKYPEVNWIDKNYINSEDKTKGLYENFINKCVFGQVIKKGNSYIYTLPMHIFFMVRRCYILTYMFEGQYLAGLLKLYSISYTLKSVYKPNSKYFLIPYNIQDTIKEFKEIYTKIHLYEGSLNSKDKRKFALTHTYLNNKDKEIEIKQLKTNIHNYITNVCPCKSENTLWTTLKDKKEFLKGKGYTKGFLSLNARSTNKYKDRTVLIYLYNKYINPIYEDLFNAIGGYIGVRSQLDEELYALSELVQWMFRSAIREKKDVYLYLPSYRMREQIFKNFEELFARSYENYINYNNRINELIGTYKKETLDNNK